MDTFDLLVELWTIFLDWVRKTDITVGTFSFTFLDFWIFVIIAGILTAFIADIFDF